MFDLGGLVAPVVAPVEAVPVAFPGGLDALAARAVEAGHGMGAA